MKQPTHYRQGDVLLIHTTDAVRGKEVPIRKLGPVLALGEATGHHHTVVAHPETYVPKNDLPGEFLPDLGKSLVEHADEIIEKMVELDVAKVGNEPACRLYEDGDFRMLDVSRFTLLRHEEHPAVPLPPGRYEVRRQREYTPEGWRQVED